MGGLLWTKPSAGYRGKCQERIPSPALSLTSSHEGAGSFCIVSVYSPLKQGTWIYCSWGSDSPAFVGSLRWGWGWGCPEQALAAPTCHKSERRVAHSEAKHFKAVWNCPRQPLM